MDQQKPPAGVLKLDSESAAHHQGAMLIFSVYDGDVTILVFYCLPLVPGCSLLVDQLDLLVQADLQNPEYPNQVEQVKNRSTKEQCEKKRRLTFGP